MKTTVSRADTCLLVTEDGREQSWHMSYRHRRQPWAELTHVFSSQKTAVSRANTCLLVTEDDLEQSWHMSSRHRRRPWAELTHVFSSQKTTVSRADTCLLVTEDDRQQSWHMYSCHRRRPWAELTNVFSSQKITFLKKSCPWFRDRILITTIIKVIFIFKVVSIYNHTIDFSTNGLSNQNRPRSQRTPKTDKLK